MRLFSIIIHYFSKPYYTASAAAFKVFFTQKIKELSPGTWQKRKHTEVIDSGVLPLQKGFGKKRGREKKVYCRKEAAHGFRNLSVYKLQNTFERPITKLKTKIDDFVNGFYQPTGNTSVTLNRSPSTSSFS